MMTGQVGRSHRFTADQLDAMPTAARDELLSSTVRRLRADVGTYAFTRGVPLTGVQVVIRVEGTIPDTPETDPRPTP